MKKNQINKKLVFFDTLIRTGIPSVSLVYFNVGWIKGGLFMIVYAIISVQIFPFMWIKKGDK